MGKYYKTTEEMYKILGALFEKGKYHAEVGPKMQKAKIKVRFKYRDPDGQCTVNTKDAPADSKAFFEYQFGPSDLDVDVELSNSADFAHRFWHGKENAVLAITLGRMKAKGDLNKALALLPAIKPMFKEFPRILREMGRKDIAL